MICEKAKNLITIGIYGKLTSEQRKELESHLNRCPDCARLHEKSALLMDVRSKAKRIPSPDMEKSWNIISQQIQSHSRPPKTIPVPRWVLVSSSLLIVFILGYFAGKGILKTGPRYFTGESLNALSFAAYADHLKPVLVNFLNQDRSEVPDKIRRLEKETIKNMLLQTRLLRELAAQHGNTERLNLLQDMEFILVSMSNLDSGNQEEAQHLIRMIRKKNVSFRLKALITVKSSI